MEDIHSNPVLVKTQHLRYSPILRLVMINFDWLLWVTVLRTHIFAFLNKPKWVTIL